MCFQQTNPMTTIGFQINMFLYKDFDFVILQHDTYLIVQPCKTQKKGNPLFETMIHGIFSSFDTMRTADKF